jgi:hypothetical protein
MYYTYDENFVAVNLWWLRQYVGKAVAAQLPLSRHSSEPEPEMEEEHCLSNLNNSAPVNRFDDYRWRGEDLASLSFYEYCMLVQRHSNSKSQPSDIKFHPNHPRSSSQVQRLVTT